MLGTVGEPINPEAWIWYRSKIGGDRCPIVDTWWQTETGAIMIAPMPGVVPTKPGSATRPLPGIIVDVVDRQGKSVGANQGGFLVVKKPWPAMMRTVYGDPERYVRQYWNKWGPGAYVTGDGAKRDADGYFWLLGRVDDVKGYHDITRYPEARLIPGLVLFRWDAPLFFANAELFRKRVLDAVANAPPPVRWVVVAAEPVNARVHARTSSQRRSA